ncbi:MAG: hypothetical protein HYS27_26010 [Deltaproteobacteria bacterium]|nr:hypothetical protein [Deltaproteobacteria bacterium]
MSKGTINRPGQQPAPVRPQRQEGAKAPSKPSAPPGSSASAKLKEKKKTQHAERPRVQRPSRQHRAHGGGGAHGAGGAHAADHEGEAEAHGLAGLGGAESGDELHRHRGGEMEHVHEDEKVEHHEELHDTGAVGPDAIKRSKGDQQQGGGDGFDQGKGQREAYERYLKGNVAADKARFDELRTKGTKDDFRPDKAPKDVEALGVTRATAHVVRLFDAWTLDGLGRTESVEKMATFIGQFSNTTTIKKVLAELESKPIRDVYPLEIVMHLLDTHPELLPGVRKGSVLGNIAEVADGKRMLAGVPFPVEVPSDVRLKSFALLGGGRPGYEFAPTVEADKYSLLVDTPGRYTFALLAATLTQLGRIQKESGEAILEVFNVVVNAMDKKGEPLTPEQWARKMEEELALAGDDDDGGDASDGGGADAEAATAASTAAAPAPIIAVQIRKALDTIVRDETSGPSATTYSWDASFYRPGAPMDGEPILHLVVKSAGPFDGAWVKAREALAQKQKEFEPGRAVVTQEDFTAALRRARVR